MGRRRKIPRVKLEPGFTYFVCEYTDSKKNRKTRLVRRIPLPICYIKCKHKCKDFIETSEAEIQRNLKLLIEKYGEKYEDQIIEVDLEQKIYDLCIRCRQDCKKEGIGMLLGCPDYWDSGIRRVSKKMREQAQRILDTEKGIEIMEEPEEEKPKKKRGRPKKIKTEEEISKPKRGRGRPKGSFGKKKREEIKNAKTSKSKKATPKKTTTKKAKTTQKKKGVVKETRSRKKVKRGRTKTSGVVTGVVKSVRKVRNSKSYWIALESGEKFITNNRTTKDAEEIRNLGASGIEVVLTIRSKKVAKIDPK